MPDLNSLIQSFYGYFQKKYGMDTGNLGPGSLFLAFEKLATNLSISDFKSLPGDATVNPAIALQRGSDLINFMAQLDSEGFIAPRGDLSPEVDEQYSLLLSSANYLPQSGTDTAIESFSHVKREAQQTFDNAKMNMNLTDFWPASFTPQFWFNDQDPTIWSTYSSSTGESTQSSTGPSTTNVPPQVVLGNWRWRVVTPEATTKLEIARNLRAMPASEVTNSSAFKTLVAESPPVSARAVVSPSTRMTVDPRVANRMSVASTARVANVGASVAASRPVSSQVTSAVASTSQPVRVRPIIAKNMALNTVVLNLPAQPVSSSNYNLSFDYCLVNVTRPWLSANFLTAARWYIPGLKSGDCGGGRYETQAPPFAFLPAKLIVVKDLIIRAQWSEEDRKYAQNSASLGPFNLTEKKFENDALTCPGMQIIAWLCQVMPVLPPVSDPSAAAAPTG